ncbi:MAG: AraC family transcriptional regulator [Nannocystales bacterium]
MNVDSRIHRVHRAVLYVEARLFEPLAVNDVASAVGGSPFHLQRLFTEVYGISVAAYIRARRISESARMLRETTKPVLSIAMRCQYGSQAAFTRAFTKYIGASPAAYRDGAEHNLAEVGPATVLELCHRDNLEATPRLHWQHDPRPLVGIWGEADLGNIDDFTRQQDTLASRFGEGVEAVGLGGAMLPGGRITFFLGVDASTAKLADGPDALVNASLPAGLYAIFTHHGPGESVRHSISYFAQTWKPPDSIRKADRPSAEVFRLSERRSESLDVSLWVAVHQRDPNS